MFFDGKNCSLGERSVNKSAKVFLISLTIISSTISFETKAMDFLSSLLEYTKTALPADQSNENLMLAGLTGGIMCAELYFFKRAMQRAREEQMQERLEQEGCPKPMAEGKES